MSEEKAAAELAANVLRRTAFRFYPRPLIVILIERVNWLLALNSCLRSMC